MKDTTIISLASIGATFTSSVLGLYFIAQSRRNALREKLFDQQLKLITQIIHKQGRIKIYCSILAHGDKSFHERALDDVSRACKDLTELEGEGAAILPTELWSEVSMLGRLMGETIESYGDSESFLDNFKNVNAQMVKVALLSRIILGADELTGENLSLFSAKRSLGRLARIERDFFRGISDRINKK